MYQIEEALKFFLFFWTEGIAIKQISYEFMMARIIF
jgi:hypothetical protein